MTQTELTTQVEILGEYIVYKFTASGSITF